MCALFFGGMLALLFQPIQPKIALAGHALPARPLMPMPNSPGATGNAVTSDDIEDLRERHLLFPVQGLELGKTPDSFQDARDGHIHEAIDILAPRNTPVVAVEEGKIIKLWFSRYGGNTIYQFDDDDKYCYYYAHLESYADISEGDHVKKGEVLGFVGTSGNAPPNTPHLHFTIFKLTSEKHWWEGDALNPYQVFKP